ncbi:Tat proofreading chaperone DmsD [uncultured Adlercreutzia sp.]|uniref:Tat proofreading chaperone DmsD n=1 Tax=uncultured Adlercreutzia sp. TaxID=875803 RepID=UPI002588C60F|nr:Tat proofreading chaperone DmsD [uncultured Adlercreutzia sp.]
MTQNVTTQPNSTSPWPQDSLDDLAGVCDILAPLFLEDPVKGSIGEELDALAVLDGGEAAADWPFAANASEVESFLNQLAAGAASEDKARAALAREYRRLFVGPAKLPAPPWGSVYTDKEGVIFGEGNLRLRAWLRDHGISRLDDAHVPDDHIGNVLQLAALLATEQPDTLDEFLSLHVLPWAPHYLALLEAAAEHPFYASLAALTRATLEGARETRELSIEEPEFFR